MKKRWLALDILLFAILLSGFRCDQPLHEKADLLISTWSGAVKEAQANHRLECTATPQCSTPNVVDKDKCAKLCSAINAAGNSLNVLITATDTYCSGPPKEGQKGWKDGGPCSPVASARDALQAAMGNFQQAISDVKALGGIKIRDGCYTTSKSSTSIVASWDGIYPADRPHPPR